MGTGLSAVKPLRNALLSLECRLTRLPVVRAEAAVLGAVENPQHFVNAASDVHVVYNAVFQRAVRADDEEASIGLSLVRYEHAIGATDLMGVIRGRREDEACDSVLNAREPEPGAVAVDAVGRDADDGGFATREFSEAIRDCGEFRGAYEREIQRAKNQNQPLAFIVRFWKRFQSGSRCSSYSVS